MQARDSTICGPFDSFSTSCTYARIRSFTRNISRGTCSLRGRIASARPRSTIRLPFSIRRTMPWTISPFRSLYSSKMFWRSAPRTSWMMTCFAVCAAMRPNSAVGILIPIWSSTSASGSCWMRVLRARSANRSQALSATTVLNSKSSTSPVSSLYCASISRSAPSLRRAAVSSAFSRVSITTSRRMPLSLTT